MSELQAQAIAILVNNRPVVGSLYGVGQTCNRIGFSEVAIDVAADALIFILTVVQIAAKKNLVIDKVTALDGQEAEFVLILVGEGVGLADIVGKRQWQGLRAFQRIVGKRQTGVNNGLARVITSFAEKLLDPARIVLGPTLILKFISGEKIIPVAAFTALLELDRFAPE